MLVEGIWYYPEYRISEMPLTESFFTTPIVAYGLCPISFEKQVLPLLLFKGTTYPADSGAAESILTDILPCTSVGESVFKEGKSIIENWLKVNTKKATVYGKSLGGCQSWRSALHFPNHIAKVMAYGAPGFSEDEKSLCLELHRKNQLPEINFFCQANDPVPYSDLGCDSGVNYYEIISGSMHENSILAHADMNSTHERSAMLKLDSYGMANDDRRQLVTTVRKVCCVLYPFILIGQVCKKLFYPEIVQTLLVNNYLSR
jgi:hypothetical protein